MKYNYRDVIVPVLELDFYERCYWNNLCRVSVKQELVLCSTKFFKTNSFLRLPDVSGSNDINLIKSFYFLFTLFYGLGSDFRLHYLKKAKITTNRNIEHKFIGYFSNPGDSEYKFFLQLSFLMLRLIPYLRSKQSELNFSILNEKVVFVLSDLSNLVTGAGSLSLYYDYFDWESAILSFEFPISQASSEFRFNYNIFRFL